MAIAARTRPNLVVLGDVVSTREQKKKDGGELYAHDVTIQAGAGSVYVRLWQSAKQPVPALGTTVAWMVSVAESERNGSELAFERELSGDDLDRLVSASPVTSKN